MKPHGRKLIIQSLYPLHPTTTTPSLPPEPPSTMPLRLDPFQSPVVLAVLLVILIALFLIGCISNCMHQLPDDLDDELPPRQRQRGLSNFSPRSDSNLRKGVDPTTIRALPVYSYGGNYEMDCAICLSQFQEKEAVKAIPFCKHVFHPHCIDTWLSSHVTCPVYRSTRFFYGSPDLGVKEESAETLTVRINETCIEVRVLGVRRNSSCSSLADRAVLQRTYSI